MLTAPKPWLNRLSALIIFLLVLTYPAAADTYTFALANPDIFGTITFVSGNPNYNMQIAINAAGDVPGPETDALYGIAFQVNQSLTVSDTVYSISGVTEANISGNTETPTGNPDSSLAATTHWGFTSAPAGGNATSMTWTIVGGQKQDLLIGAPPSGNTYPNLSGNSFSKHNPFYLTSGYAVFDVMVPNLLATDTIAPAGVLSFGTAGQTTYNVIFTDTVPEPNTPWLFGSGFLLIVAGGWRKWRKGPAASFPDGAFARRRDVNGR